MGNFILNLSFCGILCIRFRIVEYVERITASKILRNQSVKCQRVSQCSTDLCWVFLRFIIAFCTSQPVGEEKSGTNQDNGRDKGVPQAKHDLHLACYG